MPKNQNESAAGELKEALDYFKIPETEFTEGYAKFTSFAESLTREESQEAFGDMGIDFTKCLAQVCMGVKPAISITNEDERNIAEKFYALNPDGFCITENYVFNLAHTKELISSHRNVFNDAPDDLSAENIKTYLESIDTHITGNGHEKIGLLYGYPEDSSEQYNEHKDGYLACTKLIFTKLDTPEVIKKAVTKRLTPEKAAAVITHRKEHAGEILGALDADPDFKDISLSDRKYLVESLPLVAPGFNFEATETDYADYNKHIWDLWKYSGAEVFINEKAKTEYIDPENKKEVETLVNIIAGAVNTEILDTLKPFQKILMQTNPNYDPEEEEETNITGQIKKYFTLDKEARPNQKEELDILENKLLTTLNVMETMITEGRGHPGEIESYSEFLSTHRNFDETELLIHSLKGANVTQEEKDYYESVFKQNLESQLTLTTGQMQPQEVFSNVCKEVFLHIYNS
jgi:hypothetical protein